MAHYRIGEEIYDGDPTTWQNVEVSAVQRALGCGLAKFMARLKEMDVDAIQAFIWTLEKRTNPSLRIGDVNFTLREYIANVVMTDEDVRDIWPALEPDEDATDKAKSLEENRTAFLESLDMEQRARLFDENGNLVPVERDAPLDPSPATET